MVQRVRIAVTKETVAAVIGLSTTGERWFSRKTHLPEEHKGFLMDDEHVQTKGRGVDVISLHIPWGKVSEFIKRYITCEGRYQVVYFSNFILLSHLGHQKLINIPYYLLHSLHNMAHFVKRSKHPKNFLSNHRLIGLLIHRGMGIPNDPLPEVEEHPNSMPVVMAELEQLNPIPAVVIEPTIENPILGPSHEPQPSAATTVKAPTVTVNMSTQRRKHKTRNNFNTTQRSKRKTRSHSNTTQRGIDKVEPKATQNPPVVATECLDFADAQTLPFDINDTNLSERLVDFMEVSIPGFTLCKEFQETILLLQAECTRITTEHQLRVMILCITR
jgi:hypothetical protein